MGTFREIWRKVQETFAQKKQGNSTEVPETTPPTEEQQPDAGEASEQEIAKQTQAEIDQLKPIWKANAKAHAQKVQEYNERGQKEIAQLATTLDSDQPADEQQPAPTTTEPDAEEIKKQTEAEIVQTKPIWNANAKAHIQKVQEHDQRGQDEINRLASRLMPEQQKDVMVKNITDGLGILSPNTEQAPTTESAKPNLAQPEPDTSKPKQGH